VRTGKAGGSGTVIYSEKDATGDFCTLVLTCWHVVEDAIKVEEGWDSVIKRKIKKEFLTEVQVEVFDYINISTVNSTNSFRAEILAYDQDHDLAILRLKSPKPVLFKAKLVEEGKIKQLTIGTPVFAVGCSLLHDPVLSPGIVTYLQEIIDNKKYLMSNADIIFGNSGGALFLAETGELIGVPSRVTVVPMGFSQSIQTWMGFSAHPLRLYEFLREQELLFVFDKSDTLEKSMERREKKKKEGLAELLKSAGGLFMGEPTTTNASKKEQLFP
jgi:S1-C subfamily serine protease